MPSDTNVKFRHRPKEAYVAVVGYYQPQGWFSFDKPVHEVRQHGAAKFAMSVWTERKNIPGQPAGFVEDSQTRERWYRVPRVWADSDPRKRVALFNAIHLAIHLKVPMTAVLKDDESGSMSLDYIFSITDVAYEPDGSAVWLRLDNGGNPTGTAMDSKPLARLRDLPRKDPSLAPLGNLRKRTVTAEQFQAACAIGQRLFAEEIAWKQAVDEVVAAGYSVRTGEVALRNYLHIRRGEDFSSLMSIGATRCFVASILEDDGPDSLTTVLNSLRAHVVGMKPNLRAPYLQLIAELEAQRPYQPLLRAAAELAKQAALSSMASEVRRLVWMRGPHHKAFRDMLEVRWEKCCCVHGSDCTLLLQASHIVPWSESDDDARSDPNNGLLLSVPLDGLFDRGHISFDDDGKLLQHKVPTSMRRHYGITDSLRLRWDHLLPSERENIRANLAKHRERHSF